MPRKYGLEVVKGNRVIPIAESNNHSSQIIREADSDRFLGSHSLGHPGSESRLAEVQKYGLFAANPQALIKGRNK
jgi:hypothetical protein